MQVKFFKIQSLDAHEGSLKIKIWLRLYWQDKRLAWNKDDYGGLEDTQFWADPSPGSSGSEIWMPDVQPCTAARLELTRSPKLPRACLSPA